MAGKNKVWYGTKQEGELLKASEAVVMAHYCEPNEPKKFDTVVARLKKACEGFKKSVGVK